MPLWEIRSLTGSAVVDCPNWLVAVTEVLPRLGMEQTSTADLVCDIQPDGVVRIHDPRTAMVLLLRQVASPTEAQEGSGEVAAGDMGQARGRSPTGVAAAGPPALAQAGSDPAEDTWTDEHSSEELPPPASLPKVSLLVEDSMEGSRPIPELALASDGFDDDDLAFFSQVEAEPVDEEVPPKLAEQLFILGKAVATAETIEEAADASLGALLSVVEAESAAVLFANLNDTGLRFIAARGPQVEGLGELQVPFGQGIAGFIHDMGAAVIVQDAAHDPRHLSEVDAQTGYRTDAILACAIRDLDGGIHGVIELLNPPGRFAPWHLDAARSVASTLAEFLRIRG